MRTEVATGAEARSVRRWLRRYAGPLVVRYLIVLVLVALLVAGYGLAYPDPVPVILLD
jgi:hypothetical protein